jgi:hypothetical protein
MWENFEKQDVGGRVWAGACKLNIVVTGFLHPYLEDIALLRQN